MKNSTTRTLNLTASFIITDVAILMIPQLVQSSRIDVFMGMILALPFSVAVAFLLLISGGIRILRRLSVWIYVIASVFSYVFIGSIVYIFSSKDSMNKILLFLPIDSVIFAIPLYLLYRIGKPAILNPEDLSSEYTRRLHDLLSESDSEDHSVYISHRKLMRSYAETSNGRKWHVLLKQDSIQELSPNQIDAAMLEAYYSRKYGLSKKLLLSGAAYVATSVDLLLMASVLLSITTSSYAMYFLIISAVAVVMMAITPFFLSLILSYLRLKVYTAVLRDFPSPDSLVSVIKKTASLMVTLRPMTQKQQMRYLEKINRITQKRINKIIKRSTETQMD